MTYGLHMKDDRAMLRMDIGFYMSLGVCTGLLSLMFSEAHDMSVFLVAA